MSRAKLARLAALAAPAAPRGAAFSSLSASRSTCVISSSHAGAAALAGALPRATLLPEAARALAVAPSRFHTAASAHVAGMKVPAPHPGLKSAQAGDSFMQMNPVYKEEDLAISPAHRPVDTTRDKVAFGLVSLARFFFDKGTGYGGDKPMTEAKWLQRFIFLETVAALPGMVGGAVRHLHSLRLMKRDNGWIHTLLEEAENERMHLLTFIQMRQPGLAFRGAVLIAQGIVFNAFFAAYILSPKTCHRFVGYLEEEAVKTYTHALADLDAGLLPAWDNQLAPPLAVEYWKLKEGAKMRDLLLAVRADEACHSHVNHTLASLGDGAHNPFRTCDLHKGNTALPPNFVEPPAGIDLRTGSPVA